MAGLEIRSLSAPDEVRTYLGGTGETQTVQLGPGPVGRHAAEPGWRWSEHVKPLAGTDFCQTRHLGYVISGRMHVVMDDGGEGECGPGDAIHIPPGHDAWVVGDEPCVFVDFGQIQDFGKPR